MKLIVDTRKRMSCFNLPTWMLVALGVLCSMGGGSLGAEPVRKASTRESVGVIQERMAYGTKDGSVTLDFDAAALSKLGWQIDARDSVGGAADVQQLILDVHNSTTLLVQKSSRKKQLDIIGARIATRGGFQLIGFGVTDQIIGNLSIERQDNGSWQIFDTINGSAFREIVFDVVEAAVKVNPADGLRLSGQIAIAPDWAKARGLPRWGGYVVGTIALSAKLQPLSFNRSEDLTSISPRLNDGIESSPDATQGLRGPDVMIGSLSGVGNFGALGAISAFSVGTTSCNAGDEDLQWIANTSEHPVIAQNMYRNLNGRFEQIGMSWVKHGFIASAGDICSFGCIPPPGNTGTLLGVGCSDPYVASLNGSQGNLGPRSEVNAFTGQFPYPFTSPPITSILDRRIQVRNDDLNPSLNPGASYWVEGQYVTADDAFAGNNNNNSSYRRASVTDNFGAFTVQIIEATSWFNPAIRAWQDRDPTVTETDVIVPGEGLLILSSKATDLQTGFWHYEYAVQNITSDRSAGGFVIPIDPGTTIQNVGFHDVDYHSGEPYDGTDWPATVSSTSVRWSTTPYATDVNANALRWGTLYNFRFDADRPPSTLDITIELFKPGTPTSVTGAGLAPATPPPNCGDSVIEGTEECDPPDGVLCDATCKTIVNDAIRGGLLWDKWWVVVGATEPTGDHSLYPPAGQQSGSTTFRCNECHGWDYKGVAGAYASGAHFTGIAGVFGTTMSPTQIFDIIKRNDVANGHDFGTIGLSDQDTRDLVQFMLDRLVDTDVYIDGAGVFVGDPIQGQTNYTTGGAVSCVVCHGVDGTTINFGTPTMPQWVGTVAAQTPREMLHKMRFGNPGTAMPSWLASGGTDQGVADIGRYAQDTFPESCLIDAHCDDGLFCNGAETCSAGACFPGSAPCPNQPCDETGDACGVADPLRGGLLWDKWWVVLNVAAPTGDHPLYPGVGSQSGEDTFRCAECHGWDYKGVSGAYGSGPHFTGIAGVDGSVLTTNQMFDLLKLSSLPNEHSYGNIGLSDNDLFDLVAFVQTLVIDTDLYIDPSGNFIGDVVQGQVNFETAGSVSCIVCHGADGTQLNFGTALDPEWIGSVAVSDPWHLLHKIRLGNAGQPMPQWLASGGTDQGAADIGKYAQATFPVDCLQDAHCDDGLFCNGAETCDGRFCVTPTPPCVSGICDDSIDMCLTGLCDPSAVVAAGMRYLAITPPAGVDPVALLVHGDGVDPTIGCLWQFVQLDGTLGASPVFQLPSVWGTINVGDEPIRPESQYFVRTVCGSAMSQDLSLSTSAVTPVWGDVNNDGELGIADIVSTINAATLNLTNVTIEQADIMPCVPDRDVQITDIVGEINAATGFSLFDDLACLLPCP